MQTDVLYQVSRMFPDLGISHDASVLYDPVVWELVLPLMIDYKPSSVTFVSGLQPIIGWWSERFFKVD